MYERAKTTPFLGIQCYNTYTSIESYIQSVDYGHKRERMYVCVYDMVGCMRDNDIPIGSGRDWASDRSNRIGMVWGWRCGECASRPSKCVGACDKNCWMPRSDRRARYMADKMERGTESAFLGLYLALKSFLKFIWYCSIYPQIIENSSII